MRVLWFVSNEPPAVAHHLGVPPAREAPWQAGLLDAVRTAPGVQIGVASVARHQHGPFESDGVMYYDLGSGTPSTGAGRVLRQWRALVEPEAPLSRCLDAVDRFAPDIIHVHGTENSFGLLAGVTAVPLLVSLQGILQACRHLDRRGLDRDILLSSSPVLFLKGGGIWYSWLALRTGSESERRVLTSCAYFEGRTRFDEAVVRTLNPAARYYVCSEVIRGAFWDTTWRCSSARPDTVFATGGRYVRKGIGTLLRAVALLRAAAAPDIRLRVAGDFGGTEGLRAVRRATARMGIADRVEPLGALGARELARELQSARAFVLSSHVDNSPNSLAEAMIVGTPSVATAVGGVPTMARDEEQALLVQDGDPYGMAGALLRVLRDDALARQLSACAVEVARARHDPEHIRATQLAIYEDVLAANH